jgi:hypothetical protein
VSIVRTKYLADINVMDPTCKFSSSVGRLNTGSADQFIGTETNAVIMTIVEGCVAVVSACLPTFRPLFSTTRLRNFATGQGTATGKTAMTHDKPSMASSRWGIRSTTGVTVGYDDDGGIPLANAGAVPYDWQHAHKNPNDRFVEVAKGSDSV